MARRRKAASVDDPYTPVIEYYRERLSRPAPPVEDFRYPPVTLGPTWERTPDGRHWKLPQFTLGWQMLGWTGVWLQQSRGKPWVWTDEQARFLLHWYATDDKGRFLARDGVLQRLKGHGKDPLGAGLAANEAFGPCRVDDVDADGNPVGTDHPEAWIQTAAVSLEQTKNTMRLFPTMLTDAARREYGIMVGKEQVTGVNGTRLIQAVTSSPSTLEGARATFVLLNETHHWLENNDGHEMAAVISRNATKSVGGSARTLRITNAFDPSQDSVALHDRVQHDDTAAGLIPDVGLLYDSLEAPPEAPLSAEAAPDVLAAVRGDSVWLDIERISQEIMDTRNPPSRSRRFWYNQIVSAEDSWINALDLPFCVVQEEVNHLFAGDEIVMFIDCSKTDDATALVGCRLSDGMVSVLGLWQKPPGTRGDGWIVSREAVDQAVQHAMDTYRVTAFWGDPSHVLDDETQERYWDAMFDEWHRRYSKKLAMWAVKGVDGHSIMWDMTSQRRVEQFTAAAERTALEIAETAKARKFDPSAPQSFAYDGDGRLTTHFKNARRYPNKFGTSVWKGHRESKRKIDAAVAAIAARMMRRLLLNDPKRRRSGRVY